VAELLRNGITTFVEFGSQLRVVGDLGIPPISVQASTAVAGLVVTRRVGGPAQGRQSRHRSRTPQPTPSNTRWPASDAHNGRLDLQTPGRGKAFRFVLWTTKNNYRYLSGGRIAVASTSMRYEGSARRVICSSVEAGSAPLLAKKDARTSR
jgi:hypothetical protein